MKCLINLIIKTSYRISNSPAGLFFMTFGPGHFNTSYEKMILSNGFFLGYEYLNTAHGINCNDKQRVYFLDTKKYLNCQYVINKILAHTIKF